MTKNSKNAKTTTTTTTFAWRENGEMYIRDKAVEGLVHRAKESTKAEFDHLYWQRQAEQVVLEVLDIFGHVAAEYPEQMTLGQVRVLAQAVYVAAHPRLRAIFGVH